MKTITTLKIEIFAIIFFSLIALSCKRDNNELRGGDAFLNINFAGYKLPENNSENLNKSASSTGASFVVNKTFDQNSNSEVRIPFSKEYDLVATISSEPFDEINEKPTGAPVNNSPENSSLQLNVNPDRLSRYASVENTTQTVTRNIKYRIVIFEASSGKYIGQKVYTNNSNTPEGESTLWRLDGGKHYKFIAYSNNNNTAPKVYNPDQPNEIHELAANNDFLYFEEILLIKGEQNNNINILFRYMNNRVDINITSHSKVDKVVAFIANERKKNTYNLQANTFNFEYDSESKNSQNLTFAIDTTNAKAEYKFVAKPGEDIILKIPTLSMSTGAEFADAPRVITRNNLEFTIKDLTPGERRFVNIQLKRKIIDIRKLATGGYHTLAISKEGLLYGTGYIPYGLGITREQSGGYDYISEFTNISALIPALGKIKDIQALAQNSVILNEDGEIFVSGRNFYGELGMGNVRFYYEWKKLNLPTKAKQIFAGSWATYYIDENDDVYASGWNPSGQLGIGITSRNTLEFVKVTSLDPYKGKIKAVYPGYDHNIILTTDNKILGAGANPSHRFGYINETANRTTFVEIPFNFGTIKEVRAGRQHTMVLTEDGKIYATGLNHWGQLALPNRDYYGFTQVNMNTPTPAHIYNPGEYFTFYSTSTGELYGTGETDYYQLGFYNNDVNKPFKKLEVPNVSYVLESQIAWSSMVITQDNEVYGTGYNSYGSLGLSDYRTRTKFVKLPLKFIQ